MTRTRGVVVEVGDVLGLVASKEHGNVPFYMEDVLPSIARKDLVPGCELFYLAAMTAQEEVQAVLLGKKEEKDDVVRRFASVLSLPTPRTSIKGVLAVLPEGKEFLEFDYSHLGDKYIQVAIGDRVNVHLIVDTAQHLKIKDLRIVQCGSPREQGVVNVIKGEYGFITPDAAPDQSLFFHFTQCIDKQTIPRVGDCVEFNTGTRKGQLFASRVVVSQQHIDATIDKATVAKVSRDGSSVKGVLSLALENDTRLIPFSKQHLKYAQRQLLVGDVVRCTVTQENQLAVSPGSIEILEYVKTGQQSGVVSGLTDTFGFLVKEDQKFFFYYSELESPQSELQLGDIVTFQVAEVASRGDRIAIRILKIGSCSIAELAPGMRYQARVIQPRTGLLQLTNDGTLVTINEDETKKSGLFFLECELVEFMARYDDETQHVVPCEVSHRPKEGTVVRCNEHNALVRIGTSDNAEMVHVNQKEQTRPFEMGDIVTVSGLVLHTARGKKRTRRATSALLVKASLKPKLQAAKPGRGGITRMAKGPDGTDGFPEDRGRSCVISS